MPATPIPAGARRVEFEHGDLRLALFLPESADDLIDEAAFATDERLPYWADLWPSAVALARHVRDGEPQRRQGQQDTRGLPTDCPAELPAEIDAIELGCGVGLVSLVAAAGGLRVMATDYEPMALQWTSRNATANGLTVGTAIMDWRAPSPGFTAALVLAADVLYEERNAVALAAALPNIVAKSGRVLLADPGRRWLRPFLDRMLLSGWSATTLERRHEHGTAPGARESEVVIVELRQPPASTPKVQS